MPKPTVSSNPKVLEDLDGKPCLNEDNYNKETLKLYDNMDFDKNYSYYHIMGHEEPHLIRRRKILAAHPEIKLLYGYDTASIWAALALVLC